MADWSKLPYDMLEHIVLKLDVIDDLARFSIVCRSWYRAFVKVKHLAQPSTPWLLLAETMEENPECLRKVFSVHNNRCFQLKLPETIGRRCWGSNYGWIVTVGLDRDMHLFNPLTKTRFCLPHQLTLPHQPDVEDVEAEWEWFCKAFVRRAIVLQIHNEFLVMVIYGEFDYLAFARPGDQVWTPISGLSREPRCVHDVCYHYGKILVIFRNGSIGWCDLSSPSAKVIDYLSPPSALSTKNRLTGFYRLYLVNSFGDLLVVVRHKEVSNENICYKTVCFIVFRPDFKSKEWVEVNDLGDAALFVGDNCSISITTSHSLKYRRNHVYFTDDACELWLWPGKGGGHDMGSYDMDYKEIMPYYDGGDLYSKFCPSLWFTPRF